MNSIVPKIGMMMMWCEDVVLPCGGVGKWVVRGNEGLTEEGVVMVFCLYVCLSSSFGR